MNAWEQLVWAIAGAAFIVLAFWLVTGILTRISSSGSLSMRSDIVGLDQQFNEFEKVHRQDLAMIRKMIEQEQDTRRSLQLRVERLETGLADTRLRMDTHVAEG